MPAHTKGRNGILFVICSPSGGGKGTLIRLVLNSVPHLGYSVSWTTRPPRPGEVQDKNYHFTTIEEFERLRAEGEFLEWAVVHGNLYGTSLSAVKFEMEAGRDVVLEIDVQGAETVRQKVNNSVGVFILPPSFDELRERLLARKTDPPGTIVRRLQNARGEVERYGEFDYIVLNDEVERAAAQLAAIVLAERVRCERQADLARRVLSTFSETVQPI
ncbi:MAG TPA: guanylate kinase [Pyrinomonadaceae bacterium]|nr:guanylate kinase [Pyrinomonadaceae bacterium]